MQSRSDIAHHIVSVCHRLYEKGFVAATDGNVSARLTSERILTTPTGLNKGKITIHDLVEVTLDGVSQSFNFRASTETGMHLFIYQQREDVHAVVHAHPVYATGFATARIPLTDCLFPEVIVGLGAIPLAPYATPSTPEMVKSLEPFVRKAHAILLTNHGVVTYGSDLDDAYFKMEKVEHAAHIAFVARLLGGAKPLTSEEVERLHYIAQPTYGKEVSELLRCRSAEEGTDSDEEIKQLIREALKERVKTDRPQIPDKE